MQITFSIYQIPDLQFDNKRENMMSLVHLNKGEKGKITEVANNKAQGGSSRLEECPRSEGRAVELGLRLGKTIEVLQKGKFGPMLVKVDETRIALGYGLASKIMVKKIEEN